jgi:hypothetical protein
VTRAGLGKDESLSAILLASLPSQADTVMICKARGQLSIFFHKILTPESLLETPGLDQHPALIAKHMLLLATYLQHLHSEVHEEINDLSEQPRVIMKRLANTAISLVTTNDELVGSIEGLECIMLEATYQLNWGNLRRALIATRRAVLIAQLMGLHRSVQCKVLDPKTEAHPQEMWFRILHCDRALSLFLGIPQVSLDHSMASDEMLASHNPMGRLERMHSVIVSRIMARNESKSSSHDFVLTQEIDLELQKAAKNLPSKWWLMPNLTAVASDKQALYSDTGRLVDQVFHYNLLNMLHLPQMMRSSSEHKYEYSKTMCANAAREILSRFNMFRSFNKIASSFRIIDFLALIAGMTLLLAHLDSHSSRRINDMLAHQCLGDRAIIEQVLENMVEVSRLNKDALSAQSADLLGKLSAMEAQVADGKETFATIRQGHLQMRETETKLADEDDNRIMPDWTGNCLVAEIAARFGVINLCGPGESSKEALRLRSSGLSTNQIQSLGGGESGMTSSQSSHARDSASPVEAAGFDGPGDLPTVLQSAFDTHTQPVSFSGDTAVVAPFAGQLPNDSLLQQYPYHDLTAGVEDWAFQGVDMAFVDSLMRGTGDDNYTSDEWLAWQNHS